MAYLIAFQTHHVFRHAQPHPVRPQARNVQQCIEGRCEVIPSQQSLHFVSFVLGRACPPSSRRERLEAVLTDLAVYFTIARYPLVGQLLGQGDSQIIAQIWGRQCGCSAQSGSSWSYWPGTDPRSTKAREGPSPSPLEPDVDRADIQAESPKEIAVQALQFAHCRATGRKRSLNTCSSRFVQQLVEMQLQLFV